jgi:Fic family protein
MNYIHERNNWPNLTWQSAALTAPLAAVRHRQGRLIGQMSALGFPLREEAVLRALTEDVIKSSEIEGEALDRDQVRSSIARRLGMDIGGLVEADRHVDGVVEMILDATQNYAQPLTADRLFGWHAALFPAGRSGLTRITVGAWRTGEHGPMQVVSGPVHREKVHYEAPSAERLDAEMAKFLDWFETAEMEPVLKAAVAHFWFVTIHPFDDGNGRIARAIADLALARAEETPQRFYSMSTQIRHERKAYYDMLEQSQKGDLDITPWIEWFLGCLDRAFDGAEVILGSVIRKAKFWETVAREPLNERQRKVLNRLLDGFEGKLTNAKWAALTKTSSDTALRDITDLVHRGILLKDGGGGRSTGYQLAEPDFRPADGGEQ